MIRMCPMRPSDADPVDGWTVRVLAEDLFRTWRPELPDDPWNRVRVRAGQYLFCPTCSRLADAGRIGDLAAHRSGGDPGTEDTGALLALLAALGPAEPWGDHDGGRS